jgi:hypothetical protein
MRRTEIGQTSKEGTSQWTSRVVKSIVVHYSRVQPVSLRHLLYGPNPSTEHTRSRDIPIFNPSSPLMRNKMFAASYVRLVTTVYILPL